MTLAETAPQKSIRIRVGHSPDADDAFMFYGLAKDTFDTGPYQFEHELVDIETLNHRAFRSVRLILRLPVTGCSPSLSGAIP